VKRIRIGVVGCGAIARRSHLPALLANPDVEVTGLCDVDRGALQDLAKRFSLAADQYGTVEEFMENGRFDIVHICTPGATHFELAQEALNRGFNVLVEKPPSLSATDTIALANLARAKGLKIATVLSARYREEHLAIRSVKERGDLGRIIKIQAIHHANLVLSESPVLWDERESKYLIYEFGIHLLDLMVDLCGPHSKVLFVNPIYNVAINSTTDIQVCILFESGAVGLLDITSDSTRHSSYFTHFYVFGTAMDAFVRYFPPSFRLAAGLHNPLEILKEELRSFGSLALKILTGRYLSSRNRPHELVISEFIECVKQGKEFPLELKQVIPTMKLLDEIAQNIPGYRK
jgi:predicted dehydrogenase